jgi:hypothetical protein
MTSRGFRRPRRLQQSRPLRRLCTDTRPVMHHRGRVEAQLLRLLGDTQVLLLVRVGGGLAI